MIIVLILVPQRRLFCKWCWMNTERVHVNNHFVVQSKIKVSFCIRVSGNTITVHTIGATSNDWKITCVHKCHVMMIKNLFFLRL